MSLGTVGCAVESVLQSVGKCVMEAYLEATSQAGWECAIEYNWKLP